MEQANIQTKQEAIENVRKIAALENQNQTLEAKVKMFKETKGNTRFEDFQTILEAKDKKINSMIKELEIQKDLKEDLEQVQREIDSLKQQIFDTQFNKQI